MGKLFCLLAMSWESVGDINKNHLDCRIIKTHSIKQQQREKR